MPVRRPSIFGSIYARLGVPVLLLNVIAASVAWWVISDRREAVYLRSESIVQNLSEVLGQEVTSSLDTVDHALLTVIDQVNDSGLANDDARASIAKTIEREMTRRPDISALRVVNATGDIILGAGPSQFTGVNVADRGYFLKLKTDPDRGMVFSEPLTTRFSGKPGIVLARAMKDRAGQFNGVVYALILSATFEAKFSFVQLGQKGAISLRTSDLALVARYTGGSVNPAQVGSRTGSDELRASLAKSPAEGTYVATTQFDGVERVNSYHRLARYPFYLLVGLGTNELLHDLLPSMLLTLGRLAVFALVTLISACLIFRSWKRREFAIARLAKREAEFTRIAAQVPGVISQFQLLPDGRMRAPFVSEAVRELFELAPDEISEDAARLFARVHPDDVAMIRDAIGESARTMARASIQYRVVLPQRGERWLRTDSQPALQEDGSTIWYGHNLDITEQKRVEQTLREHENQLAVILESTADGIMAANCAGMVLRANSRVARMWGIPAALAAAGDHYAMLDFVRDKLFEPDAYIARVRTLYQSMEVDVCVVPRVDGKFFERTSAPLVMDGRLHGRVWSYRDVTAQKLLEIKLTSQLAMTEAIIHAEVDGLSVCQSIADAPYIRFTVWNPAMEALTGHNLDEINRIGWYQSVHSDPAKQEQARLRIERVFSGDHLHGDEWTITRRDGTQRTVLFHTAPVVDSAGAMHVLAVLHDVTVQKAAEAALRESEARFRATFERAPVGVINVAPDGHFIDANQSFCDLVGYGPEELLGMTTLDVTHPDSVGESARMTKRLFAGEISSFVLEKQYLRRDGRPFWVILSAGLVRGPDGTPSHAIGVIEDIDRRRQAEDALVRLKDQLEVNVAARTRSLVDANAELQTITYTLAHDLRQPARHVAGLARLLIDSYGSLIPEKGRYWLKLMNTSAERQAEMIGDMLSYVKLGYKDLAREPVDMRELAEELRKAACDEDERAAKAGWRLGDLPAVDGDRALIRVILSNLMANAVKYSARGEAPQIEIGAKQQDGRPCAYFVRDNGVGFDAAGTAQLFGLFQRFHDPVEYPGNGIGLAIVKRLVEKHGGRTWAESAPGAGATFYFTLQAEEISDEHRTA